MIGERTIRRLGAFAAASYLALTVAYNAPQSPARQAMGPLLDATIGRYFPQDWRMFAPNPARSNTSVLVACVDAATLAERRTFVETASTAWAGPWADISAPLARAHQRARLSAYDRLLRAQTSAARNTISLPPGLERWTASCHKGDTASCEFVTKTRDVWRKSSTEYLTRVASSYCRAVAPETAGVGLRIRDRPAVPWSQRHDDRAPDAAEIPLGFFPIADDVMPSPIYQPG